MSERSPRLEPAGQRAGSEYSTLVTAVWLVGRYTGQLVPQQGCIQSQCHSGSISIESSHVPHGVDKVQQPGAHLHEHPSQ